MNWQLRRNMSYGLAGFAVPTVVLLAAYPILLRHLGATRFGIYLLATSISGTLAFLDFGFSAATLKFLAEDIAQGKPAEAAEVVVTSLTFYGSLGAVCAAVLALSAPTMVSLFAIAPALRGDSIVVFRLAAAQFAVFLLISVFLAVFKGMQRFQDSTLVLASLSILTFGGAAAAAAIWGVGMVGVTATCAGMNVVVLIGASIAVFKLCRKNGLMLSAARPSWKTARRMFAFGSVLTVNSICALLLYQLQRYMVGIVIGPAAVTVYQTASVGASKIHAAVAAATEVMFPFSSGLRERKQLRHVYLRMLAGSALLALAGFTPLFFFGRQLVTFWLGAAMAVQVMPLLPILALAYFCLALTPAPYHLANGLGRPGVNTAFHALSASLNIVFIGLFLLQGITLVKFAWAFTLANILASFCYQCAIEILIWKDVRLFARSEQPLQIQTENPLSLS